MFTINCKGRLHVYERPVVMGIINATPDSFYEQSRASGPEHILEQATAMIAAGADIIDIGGQSTRPGSHPVLPEEEISRVIPGIKAIMHRFPDAIISIDTYYAEVARQAVAAGASMVNDISGGRLDNNMLATVAGLNVPFICMHMKGTPLDMASHAQYADVTAELLEYFSFRMDACRKAGIKDIIIDPGFGFAKTPVHGFELLRNLNIFKETGCPLLVGLSRKSMICKTLGVTQGEALNGTTALNMLALSNGADILRVHDVKEAVETVKLFEAYEKAATIKS